MALEIDVNECPFGLYQPEKAQSRKMVKWSISNPNDANDLGLAWSQHFMLVDVFTVLENII